MDRLADKVAIITGAARGQGRAMAELFVKEGATVVAADVLEPADPQGSGAGIDFATMDVTKEAEWDRVVTETVQKYGKLDILVNNAAIITYEPILDTTPEIWDRIMDVDLKALYLGMRAALPHLIATGNGAIVNVSSIWGLAAVPSAHAYHAAKGAILNMTKNVAAAHGPDGVRANSLHPGYILSPMNEDQADDINAALIAGTLLKRPGVPAETAAAVLFLASDEASYITGTSLVVDGGYLAP
ncbi:SDR family NAD(P)-dependent oxidoreductase [Herbiconiux ginsengi]|uniref:NAD(P)-dependent dehydrogenase, short-chain alcohol dehydrogenase family n=1 Tax=Herbiconiux ginsengi TaxID=381665 RepID=A0A1H3TT38_9MICO|nr:glucose 1-dehydrogenase [Herbiconiux ginsengi]SDZ52489.1 NAD(P)-dependent dehydrogenase, short-chain alcohol dehydrogenase family [Herbiconiux ginsengi]